MKASEMKPDTRFFGMFVSKSSAGKSCASASFPDPKLTIDTDLRKGIMRAADWGVDLSRNDIKSFPPMTSSWVDIEKLLESVWMMFKGGQRPYETICVASITTLVRLFMNESVENRQEKTKGKFLTSAPIDYKFESQVTLQVFDYLRSLPCNVIIEGHLINIWGKDPATANLEYQPDIVLGEELSIRHRLGENLLIYFDEVYKFTKSLDGQKHFVEFQSQIARSVYKMPRGPADITNKNFYQYWLSQVQKQPVIANEIKK